MRRCPPVRAVCDSASAFPRRDTHGVVEKMVVEKRVVENRVVENRVGKKLMVEKWVV